jgi:hypothetical protein
MNIMLIMSCYTGFFNVRRGWQSLNTGPRFYLHFIRRTGWLWIYTSRTTDGRPFKPKKLSVPFLHPGVPAGFVFYFERNFYLGKLQRQLKRLENGLGYFGKIQQDTIFTYICLASETLEFDLYMAMPSYETSLLDFKIYLCFISPFFFIFDWFNTAG